MSLLFENKIPNTGINNREKFLSKVKYYSNLLLINPDWLMAVMFVETGGTFSPSEKNPSSSASGLIQFMADTAIRLGTTVAQLRAMSNYAQMDYVYKYLKSYTGRMTSYPDVYMAVFAPVAIGKADSVLIYKGSTVSVNNALDYNKDNAISVGEIKKWAWSRIPTTYHETLKKKV